MVVDPSSHSGTPMSIVPLEVSEHDSDYGTHPDQSVPDADSPADSPAEVPVIEVRQDPEDHMEVIEPGEIEIVVDELPGAPHGSKDPEPEMEVSEDVGPKVDEDANDAKKSKKDPKWDWETHGPKGFIVWVKDRLDGVPKHSGQDTAGLERAIAYLDRLDGEISRAMRMDLDGELDADQIEKVRSMIDDGISRLNDRLDKVKKVKKIKRSKKKNANVENNDMLVKEAQKIMGVSGGVVIVADLLTSRIAKVIVNGCVSAGHDINDLMQHQVKEYGLNKREQACVRELLESMGFPLREDRYYDPSEDHDIADGEGDWVSNFKG